MVDGLDEDLRPPEAPSVAGLLPTTVGPRGHVLVSSRPFPRLPCDIPDRHPLPVTEPTPLAPFQEPRS